MASTSEGEDENWDIKFRQDEEMEYFTELALHEAERWITAVTRKKFSYPEDFRKSLGNGVLLCELLNCLKPGSVKRINKLPTPLAGLDNINVFLAACRKSFHLTDNELFDPCDLEDLSQRAIADCEADLKIETDRRTLNVAIAIFWLGKSVSVHFSGPQLDQSAFTALVRNHGKDLTLGNHKREDSTDSNCQSSAYGSHDSCSKISDHDTLDDKHLRNNSYDSYSSYSRESDGSFNLEDEDAMPAGAKSSMRRYGSAGSLNTSSGMKFSTTGDSVNVDDDSMYRSNPNLANNHHRRGSSTDSMDSSAYSHSRQSSEDVEIPTRTLRTQRKASTTNVNPLQFVKPKPSEDLAKKAQEQIKATQEVKTFRTKVEKDDDDWQSMPDTFGDWQSNLSSWKTKRRRASAATYQRVEETDNLASEEKEDKKNKTYSQMLEAREKRKSTGMLNFYPITDEEDSLTWTPKSPPSQDVAVEQPISRGHVTKSETSPSSRLAQRYKRSDTAPAVTDSYSRADVKDSAPVVMETVTKNRHYDDDRDNATGSRDAEAKVTASPMITSSLRLESTPASSGGEAYVRYDDQDVADWAKDDGEDGSTVKDERPSQKSSTEKPSEHVTNTKVFDDKFNRGKTSDVTKRYSDIIPPWKRESMKENSPENHSSVGKSTSKISNILKSFETKTEDVNSYEKPKKAFEFSASTGKTRAKWQSIEKEDSSVTHSKPVGKLADRQQVQNKQSSPEIKDFVEKNIRINQKPNNAKGFGFSIQGGVDKKCPVTVQRVNLGSAADVCELQMKDQIVTINKKDIGHMTQPQVQRMIDDSVKIGQIDLKVKRPILEEEDDLDDEAFENESPTISHLKTDHKFSPPYDATPQPSFTSPLQTSTSHDRPERNVLNHMDVERKKTPPVPAKRSNSQKGRIREDPEEQKRWIMEHLQSANPEVCADEPNNNDVKNEEESESESDVEEQSPVLSPPQQEVVIRPQIEAPRKPEVARQPEREIIETRPTISVSRKPEHEVVEPTVITPQKTVQTESVMSPESVDAPPPPPPSAAPPPLKYSNLDVDGFKPPDILKRWQRGSRGARSDNSSPTSVDSDGEKRLSSSSLSWQNELSNTGGSQTSPGSTFSYDKDYTEPHVGQPVTIHLETTPSSQLIIDPRNQVDYDESSLPQYNFHVDISTQNNSVTEDGYSRGDDISRSHSSRSYQNQREDEEQRKLQEREEKLKRDEEKLRLEREKFRQEQERLRQEQEKEQMERMKNLTLDKTSHSQTNGHYRPNENITQFSVTMDTNQAQPRRLEEVWNPNSQHNKDKQRWSREDMLAMNRKATPLQTRPEVEESVESERSQPVNRDAPSRTTVHSLNAAPKPKYKGANDWMSSARDNVQNDVQMRRKSEYSDPNSHWLIEEAERRREKAKRHSVHTPYGGPIKAVHDRVSNRWRDDSSVPQQQTFTSTTSVPPRPVNTRQFSAKPQNQLSQTLPSNYGIGNKREPLVPPKPARQQPASPTSPPSHAEQIMAVSGKQLCSHCSQELGFGAAMVIESLGLYYHVQCFRCCVCHTTLGNGSQGADVRIRVNKLHCRNCYSNDEAGLKFSKV